MQTGISLRISLRCGGSDAMSKSIKKRKLCNKWTLVYYFLPTRQTQSLWPSSWISETSKGFTKWQCLLSISKSSKCKVDRFPTTIRCRFRSRVNNLYSRCFWCVVPERVASARYVNVSSTSYYWANQPTDVSTYNPLGYKPTSASVLLKKFLDCFRRHLQ